MKTAARHLDILIRLSCLVRFYCRDVLSLQLSHCLMLRRGFPSFLWGVSSTASSTLVHEARVYESLRLLSQQTLLLSFSWGIFLSQPNWGAHCLFSRYVSCVRRLHSSHARPTIQTLDWVIAFMRNVVYFSFLLSIKRMIFLINANLILFIYILFLSVFCRNFSGLTADWISRHHCNSNHKQRIKT